MLCRSLVRTLLATGLVAAAAAAQATVTFDMVTIGAPDNAADDTGFGAVDHTYQVAKFEVTAGQYVEFLNAVAKTDTYGLYIYRMNDPTEFSHNWGDHVSQTGTSGSYVYSVPADYANLSMGALNWANAARFCNWLSNGQPTGAQGPSTTESGSYTLNGAVTATALQSVEREPGAQYVMPTYDEWYKAAFYDINKPGGPGYWDYATKSDVAPGNSTTDTSGNNANYDIDGTESGYCIGAPYYRTAPGTFVNSVGPWGTFDQDGNVREWNETHGDLLANRLWSGGSFILGDEVFLAAGELVSNVTTLSGYANGLRVAFVGEVAGGDVVWTGTGGTAWSSTGNWTPGSTPNGVMNTFDDTATGLTADIASAATPTSVVFNNSSKNFTITGTSGIGGTATVLKQGTGTVTMSSVNTYSGVTTVEAGKLILSGAAKAMVPVLNNGGADIKGGMLVLDYATEADPVATVKNLLTTSYAAGAWNTGKFQSSTSSSSRGLGWTDNTGTSKINVAYTVYGDTNLDGTTNFTDLSKLLSKYGQTGKVWADGDTNYDGVVNFTDLSKMLSTYGQSVGSLTPSPEPSTMVLLVTLAGLVGAWVIRRRGQ